MKNEVIRNFSLSLLPDFTAEQINVIVNNLLLSLEGYDIVKSCTDLVPYDYTNEVLLRDYYGCLIIAGKSERTAKTYIYELKRLINFKGKKLTEITSIDLKEYMAYILAVKKCKKSTANNAKNFLSSFFKWLNEEGYVEVNPCLTLKSVKQEKKIKEVFSEIELERMRDLNLCLRDRVLIEFLLSTGVRVEEFCSLDISDIDMHKLTVLVRDGKGGKDRITYMSKVTAYYLNLYLQSREDTNQALFLNYPNRNAKYQNRITMDGVRNVLKEIGLQLGIKKCHPHKFRRTLATMLYKKDMPVHEIQLILGHNDISVTMEYIVSDNNMTKSAYDKFIN